MLLQKFKSKNIELPPFDDLQRKMSLQRNELQNSMSAIQINNDVFRQSKFNKKILVFQNKIIQNRLKQLDICITRRTHKKKKDLHFKINDLMKTRTCQQNLASKKENSETNLKFKILNPNQANLRLLNSSKRLLSLPQIKEFLKEKIPSTEKAKSMLKKDFFKMNSIYENKKDAYTYPYYINKDFNLSKIGRRIFQMQKADKVYK